MAKQIVARVWRWAGLVSGIVGLVVLLKLVDGRAVATALQSANMLLLVLAALVLFLTTALRAWRWQFLFRQREVRIRFRQLGGTILISSFYDQFLPASSAVGAALLVAETMRHGGGVVDFMATALMERILNLLSLFLVASLVLWVAPPAGLPGVLVDTIQVTSIGLVAALLVLRQGWGMGSLESLLTRLRLEQLGRGARALRQALQSDLGCGSVLVQGLGLSVPVNACIMLVSYLVTMAVAGAVSLLDFIAVAVLIVALQGIPVTPGALGLREGLHVFFLGLVGVGEPVAMTVGLLVTLLNWLQGLAGGLVLLKRGLPAMGERDGERLYGAGM